MESEIVADNASRHEVYERDFGGTHVNGAKQPTHSPENAAVPLPSEETCFTNANTDKLTVDVDMMAKIQSLEERIKVLERGIDNRLDRIEQTLNVMLQCMSKFKHDDPCGSPLNTGDHVPICGSRSTSPMDKIVLSGNAKHDETHYTPKLQTPSVARLQSAHMKNIETILIPEDDDVDEVHKSTTFITGKFMREHTPFMSNYNRGVHFKGKIPMQTTLPPRKLAYPAGSLVGRTSKKPKTETQPFTFNVPKLKKKKDNPNGNTPSRGHGVHERPRPKLNANRGNGEILPKGMPCVFKPTVDMNLTALEAQVCAYIFNPKIDPMGKEIVFRIGQNFGTRRHFESLCPNKAVGDEIVLFMALKITHTQMNGPNKSVWCLPPAFTADVLSGTSVDKLVDYYGKDFMPSYACLNLIYIPIFDHTNHCYLMVICMNDKKIYHLDSHFTVESLEDRTQVIRTMGEVMCFVLATMFDIIDISGGIHDMNHWDIVQPRGIPNCGSSENSTVWVLEWMQMQECFVTILYGLLDEKHVRMKVAMTLLLGPHNDMKNTVVSSATMIWDDFLVGIK